MRAHRVLESLSRSTTKSILPVRCGALLQTAFFDLLNAIQARLLISGVEIPPTVQKSLSIVNMAVGIRNGRWSKHPDPEIHTTRAKSHLLTFHNKSVSILTIYCEGLRI